MLPGLYHPTPTCCSTNVLQGDAGHGVQSRPAHRCSWHLSPCQCISEGAGLYWAVRMHPAGPCLGSSGFTSHSVVKQNISKKGAPGGETCPPPISQVLPPCLCPLSPTLPPGARTEATRCQLGSFLPSCPLPKWTMSLLIRHLPRGQMSAQLM